MEVLADSYRLYIFEFRVTRMRCELKAVEMGGKGCVMCSFLMCSAC